MSRFLSRKFLLAVVAAVYSVVGAAEFQIPIDQLLVTDALIAVYIVVQGVIDAIAVRKAP